MRSDNVIQKIEEYYPPEYAMDWDNVGLLVGESEKEIHRIYITLDATDEVIDDAVKWGADLILMHHPLIFKAMKRVNDGDFIGRRLIKLIKNDIACYAMHTNYDVKGMADLAADILGMEAPEVFEVTYTDENTGEVEGIGRCANLKIPKTVKECGKIVKEKFNLPSIRIFGDPDRVIEKIAIFPGSGKSAIQEAIRQDVDLLITGDIDHHEGIDSVAQGLVIMDAGHYGIEHIYIEDMKNFCRKHFPEIEVKTAAIKHPFWVM